LIVRLLEIFVTLCGRLTLLARFLTAALLLTRLLIRRLALLVGSALVRHGVSFHGNIRTTDQSPRRSDKKNGNSLCRHYVTGSPTHSGFVFPRSLFSLF
jgi:hypothetical protein